jgi:NAD(P)-dependent dehydrogenase (short-subunit alcohol dehydrogenase family)
MEWTRAPDGDHRPTGAMTMNRILITGANRGLGLELVRLCTARGDRVFAGCRFPEQDAELKDLSARYGGQIDILPLEITDAASLDRCLQQVRSEVDALDMLINNAAINDEGETLRTFDADRAAQQWTVNAVGQVLVAQKFLDILKAGTDPKIINVTSEAGSISTMNHFRGYYYFGSKAAMNMFSRSMAWDPDTAGIITIALHPGWVRTDMGGSDAHLSVTESAEGILKVIAKLTPEDNGKFYTWDGKEYPW